MNAQKRLFILLFVSNIILVSFAVCAEEKVTDLGYSEKPLRRGYKQDNFCGGVAEDMMGKLVEKNKEKFTQIEEYRKQIADLSTYDSVINEVSAIKDRYLESLKEVSQGPAKDKAARNANLGEVKSIIRHGLILNALGDLIEHQDGSLKKSEALTMSELCKGHEKSKAICKKSDSPLNTKGNYKSHFFFGQEVHKLDTTVSNFEKTSEKLPPLQQEELKKEVGQIIKDIPPDIAPEIILSALAEQAPKTTQLLSNPIGQENLKECLNNKLDACNSIVATPEDRKALLETMERESLSVASKFKNYQTVVQAAVEANKNDLEKTLDNFDTSSKSSIEKSKDAIIDTSKLLTNAAQSLSGLNVASSDSIYADKSSTTPLAEKNIFIQEMDLNDIENFFYIRPPFNPNAPAETLKKQKEALIIARQDAAIFKNDCSFNNPSNSSNDIQKINTCKGLIEKALPQIKALKAAHAEQVRDLQNKVKRLSDDNEFAATENLKAYVAEKYMCMCEEKKSKIKTSYEESLVMGSDPNCRKEFMTLSKIEGLSNTTNIIATTLYANDIQVPLDTTGRCSFPPEKLKRFTDTCKNNSELSSEFSAICKAISNEYVAKDEEAKQEKKWDAIHEKNFVSYDQDTRQYYLVPKKSTARVIGEGVLPIAPIVIPALIGNMQVKNNIENLTNQALWIEQANYTNTYYLENAPWMFGINYFANPFNFTNSGVGATTDTSTGFNFSQ